MFKKILKIFEKKEGKKTLPNFEVKVSISTQKPKYEKREYPEELLTRNLNKLGVIEDKCPYCGEELKKRPSRKTKCPHCGKFIFVKKRPIDRVEVLITENEKDIIEKEWIQYYLNKEDIELSDDPLYLKIKEDLKKQFGLEPNISDVKWGYYETQKMEFAKIANWSGFRNVVLSQAKQLEKENKHKQALNLYLEIMWYDLTGAQRYEPKYADIMPEFDLERVFVAPGIVSTILTLMDKLNLDIKNLKKQYDDYVIKACKNPRAPLSHEEVWNKIEEELNK